MVKGKAIHGHLCIRKKAFSSYSTAALEFEQQHQLAPVFDSPRMSRRSLRLQTGGAGLYGNDSHADGPQNHVSYTTNTTTSSSSSRKETRTPRNRKQQQAVSQTLSLSQMDTPRQTLSFSALSTPVAGGGLQHAGLATDTTLLSSTSTATSVPGQASLRQRASTTTTTTTTTDGYWGSGHDVELTGHSTSHGHGLNGGAAGSVSKSSQHTTAANGYICKDCSPSTGGLSAHCASSSSSSSSLGAQAAASATGAFSSFSSSSSLSSSSMSPSSSIYSRDKSRRNKTGVLASVSSTCVRYGRKAVAPVVSLFTLLFSSVLWLGSRARSQGKGYLTSFSDSVRRVVASSMSSVWLFKQNAVRRIRGHRAVGYEGEAHSSFCGSMNVKDLVTGDSSHLKLNGSLCDDCKGKQSSHAAVTQSVLLLSQSSAQSSAQSSTQSSTQSRTQRLGGALLSFLAYTGSCLLVPGYGVVRAGKALGSGAGVAVYTVVHTVFRKLVSLICFVLAAPVRVGWGLLWFLATGWYQLVSFMSLLNVFFLTRCVPLLWRLLLLLLPLLLLLALWWWGPSAAALLAYLPATNLSLWRPASPLVLLSSLLPASGPPPAPVLEAEPTLSHATPATPISAVPPALPPAAAAAAVVALASLDLERLERLEQRLALLWEQVQRGDQQQEQRFGDTLVLHSSLREELRTQTDRDSLGLWVSALLEGKLGALRVELEEGDAHRAKKEELLQQSRAERLAEVESLLALLASRTEEVQQKQHQYKVEREEETRKAMREAAILAEAPDVPVAPISVGVNQEDHEALLAEVRRLEAELGRVRADLQGVLGCKGKCGQLDTLHDTISAQVSSEVSSQVRRELRALFYGSGQAGEGHRGGGDDDALPESLVLWLSQRYVGGPELQASLAALELAILSDVSQQLERSRGQALLDAQAQAQSVSETVRQTVSHSVQHSATAQGLSEEQVQLIVQNALRLYSQDRTGLVDYALESGGGSILSTRCSETYETKTALMSLFGLPLWYFSQSPRVVIQPDVYPGNCWAFKGSQGYLVIRLSLRVKPTAFCLEHIPKSMSPTGTITSAPRNFTVYGLGDEYQEEGKLLGEYVYQEDGDSLQTFPVMKNEQAFQIIEVRVLSNWGHPEYTCLYRFRVHGEPRLQQ
ncbi:SUN domain-containing protein 1 isoform X4 [Gadus macrocephalus]|uniref:SUN domain-containing protein 1 isoform X4 n=1 Tax=Gadus macrocephalus TaxID=80720 RepID=UPI0028CB1F2D|nr:SUN domain-containing protein 1 isoform X4 [Gadus macrocephalus]